MAASTIRLRCSNAGLNVPGSVHREPVDFPEVWAGWGAAAVGATAWAYGGRTERAYLEDLLARFTEHLFEAGLGTVGDALVSAKRAYYQQHAFDSFHEKTLVATTLYGLPMLEVRAGARQTANGTRRAAVDGQQTAGGTRAVRQSGGLFAEERTFRLVGGWGAPVTTTDGSYYTLTGERPYAENGRPILPRFTQPLGLAFRETVPVHGVFFRGGHYTDTVGFNPVVERAGLLGRADGLTEPPYSTSSWWPALPLQASRLGVTSGTGGLFVGTAVDARLVGWLGQYRGTAGRGTQRLYTELRYEVFYSDATDFTPPEIKTVPSTTSPAGIEVTAVLTTPVDAVYQVIATHTADDGLWTSTNLQWDPARGAWRGTLPSAATAFIVQAADHAGNVAVDDRGGRCHMLTRVYLPLSAR